MLRLLTVNMEGSRHYERLIPFIEAENPDCLCLQEMPSQFGYELFKRGYHVTFAPMLFACSLADDDMIGIGIASKRVLSANVRFYHGNSGAPLAYDSTRPGLTITHSVVETVVTDDAGHQYRIATTHLPVTKDGESDENQAAAVANLLGNLDTGNPHILCGDLNMPRGHNRHYPEFTARYTDAIPPTYQSSLDRSLHRHGNNPNLNRPIFDQFMVDYVFTQSPYRANNVTLHFGVSDHAAITADITHT